MEQDILGKMRKWEVGAATPHYLRADIKTAADEIARLRAALKEIVPLDIHTGEIPNGSSVYCGPMALIAKRALYG